MFTTFVNGQLFLEAWYLDLGAIEHMIIKEEHGFFSNKFPNPSMTYLEMIIHKRQLGVVLLIKFKSNMITKVKEVLQGCLIYFFAYGKVNKQGEFISIKCVINFLSKHIKFECIKEGSLYLVVARIPNSNDKLNLACVDNMGPKDTMK